MSSDSKILSNDEFTGGGMDCYCCIQAFSADCCKTVLPCLIPVVIDCQPLLNRPPIASCTRYHLYLLTAESFLWCGGHLCTYHHRVVIFMRMLFLLGRIKRPLLELFKVKDEAAKGDMDRERKKLKLMNKSFVSHALQTNPL